MFLYSKNGPCQIFGMFLNDVNTIEACGDDINHVATYRSLVFSDPAVNQPLAFLADGSVVPMERLGDMKLDFGDWNCGEFRRIADSLGRPWAHLNGDFFIHQKWRPSTEQISSMKKNGLNIFNYEPVFIYNSDGSWPWMPNRGPARYLQLEKIAAFCANQEIQPVTFYLCEPGLPEILNRQKLFPNLNFKYWSSYLVDTFQRELKLRHAASEGVTLKKKFTSLSFRYEATRELLTAFLVSRGYDADSYISYYHFHDRAEFLRRLPFDPTLLRQWPTIDSALASMQSRLPFSLEVTNPRALRSAHESIPDADGIHNQRQNGQLHDEYIRHSFLLLYVESRPFSPRAEISEKTIAPIVYGKPFLPFSGPYFLKSLRNHGFTTFGEFWDESFDEIEDPLQRYQAYLDTVSSIGDKSMAEIQSLQEKLRPVVEHNLDWARHHFVDREKRRLAQYL